MVDKYKELRESIVQYVGNKQVIWKYMLFEQHYQPGKTTSQVSVLMVEYLVVVYFELWMV